MNKLTTITTAIILAVVLSSCGGAAAKVPAGKEANVPAGKEAFVAEMIGVDGGFAELDPQTLVKLSQNFCKVLKSTTTPANAMEMLYGTMDKSTAMLAAITMAGEDCPSEVTAIAKYTGLKI